MSTGWSKLNRAWVQNWIELILISFLKSFLPSLCFWVFLAIRRHWENIVMPVLIYLEVKSEIKKIINVKASRKVTINWVGSQCSRQHPAFSDTDFSIAGTFSGLIERNSLTRSAVICTSSKYISVCLHSRGLIIIKILSLGFKTHLYYCSV